MVKRFKKGERLIADEHKEVTILFGDVVGFTPLASQLSTSQVSACGCVGVWAH